MRRYTTDEIDRMRSAIFEIMAGERGQTRREVGPSDVEDRLRTYILAGIEPHELFIREKS